jgi:excisionase family DNA binding protein
MVEETLNEILKTLKANNKSNATMTVLECSEYMNVSKEKVRELIYKIDTDFPFFKVGVKVLVNKSQLDLWLDKVSKEHRNL